MATQYRDSANNVRGFAEAIDRFMYANGDTSPKRAKLNTYNEDEYRIFLEHIRLSLWDEQEQMFRDMGNDL